MPVPGGCHFLSTQLNLTSQFNKLILQLSWDNWLMFTSHTVTSVSLRSWVVARFLLHCAMFGGCRIRSFEMKLLQQSGLSWANRSWFLERCCHWFFSFFNIICLVSILSTTSQVPSSFIILETKRHFCPVQYSATHITTVCLVKQLYRKWEKIFFFDFCMNCLFNFNPQYLLLILQLNQLKNVPPLLLL